MLVCLPIFLHEHANLLRSPNNQQKTLCLAAWKVSKGDTLQFEFLSKLQSYWLRIGAKESTQPTNQAENVGNASVIQGKLIAVSSIHAPLAGSFLGQHLLVSQILRGNYYSRPSRPRYTCTWDVDLVVQRIGKQCRFFTEDKVNPPDGLNLG